MTVIPAISQAQNRPSNTGPNFSPLIYGGLGGIPGLICIAICLGCMCRHLRHRNNHPRRFMFRVEPIAGVRTARATYQRGAEYNAAATIQPQQPIAFSIPMVPQTSALRQPVNTDSDSIGKTVNDRSLSNEPPPSYYKVQEQGTALPSYTEVIQENRSQESVETINTAGPSEITVDQELQETVTTRIDIPHPSEGAETSHEAQDNTV